MIHYRVSLILVEQNRIPQIDPRLLRMYQVTKAGFEFSEQIINDSINGVRVTGSLFNKRQVILLSHILY